MTQTPSGARPDRVTVLRQYWMRDHGWVRAVLPNFHKVDDGLYRSGHPGERVLRRAQARGVRSVLSLRGDGDGVPNLLEREACDKLDLKLRFMALSAKVLPTHAALSLLLRNLRDLPQPILVHCKSGADRTGLAATLYLHVLRDVPIAEARQQFHWTYGHFTWGGAGIVHDMLDAYTRAHAETGIGFEEWVATSYDPDAITAAFKARRRQRRR